MKKNFTKISLVLFAFMLSTVIANAQKPVITKQPVDVSAYYGNTFTISIQATGNGVQYQWQSTDATGAWVDSFGATSANYTTNIFSFQAQPKNRCKVSNASGIVYSREVIVTAICPNIKIAINPQNTSVQESKTATFSITLSNDTQDVTYVEWYINGIYNQSTQVANHVAKFTIPDVQLQLNGATVQGKVNWTCNAIYHIESTLATLTITTNPIGPKITKQLPASDTVVSGNPITMAIEATGANLSYQWWARQGRRPDLDNQPFIKVGTGNSSYTFTPLFTNCTQEVLDIYCVVSNAYGTPKSIVSTVQIFPALSQILNQPASLTVKEGASASLTFQASSSQDYTIFNWYKNGVNVFSETKCCGGVATTTYTFPTTAADQDAKVYCEVSSYASYARCSSTSLVVKTNTVKITIDGGLANGTYKLTARHSGKSLAVARNSTADGADVAQWPYTGGNNEKWVLQSLGGNEYSIRALNSGKSLDVTANSKSNGADINQWTYSGNSNQRWRVESLGSGYYRIVSVRSGKCVDVFQNLTTDATPIVQYSCSGSYNQSFTFAPVSSSLTVARITTTDTEDSTQVAVVSPCSVYPNPYTNSFTVSQSGAFLYSIRNSMGNVVESGEGTDETTAGSLLPSGLYIIYIQSEKGVNEIKLSKN